MSIISKELLSEVLSVTIYCVKTKEDGALYVHENCVGFEWNNNNGFKDAAGMINLYELAHKCKEWAYTNHEAVINIFQKTSYNPYTAKLEGKVFQSDTEPEVIFKACEWVLRQRSRRCNTCSHF